MSYLINYCYDDNLWMHLLKNLMAINILSEKRLSNEAMNVFKLTMKICCNCEDWKVCRWMRIFQNSNEGRRKLTFIKTL